MSILTDKMFPLLIGNRKKCGMNTERWRMLPTHEEQEMHISSGSIVLGYKVNVYEDMNTGTLNVAMTHHPLAIPYSHETPLRLVVRGSSGSGKTFLSYRIMSQLVEGFGLSPCIFVDPKSEMIPERNINFPMMPNEYSSDMRCTTYAPTFINAKVQGRTNIEIATSEFEPEEILFMYYMQAKIPAGVREVIEDSFDNALRIYGRKFTIAQLLQFIVEMENVNTHSKNSARNVIRSLARKKIIADKTNFDFVEDMYKGLVPIVQYDMRHEVNPSLTSCFTSYLIRKLERTMGGRVSNSNAKGLKPLMMIDESRLIAPPFPANPPSKQALINCMGITRGLGVSVLLTTLEFRVLDKSILSQCSYLINIGKLTSDFNTLKEFIEPQKCQNIDEICYYDISQQQRIAALIDPNRGTVQYFVPMAGGVIPKSRI